MIAKKELEPKMKKIKYSKYILIIFFVLTAIYFLAKKEKRQILRTFNSETKITDISQFIIRNGDTILDGNFTQYDENGIKLAEGNFLNGEPNGKSVYYFKNGNIESVYHRKNSKVTIEATLNYLNGNPRKYILYDDLGKPVFIIRYDELGNVESYEGYALLEVYQYKIAHPEKFKIKTNQLLKVGSVLKHQYLIANIPNSKRNFEIENIGVDNIKVKRTITQNPPVGIDIEEILTKKGVNTIKAVVKYKFNDKYKTVINDTISFDVEVH